MTLEETPDAFEAALAANAADVAVESAVEEIVEVGQEEATSTVDSSVDSDEDPIDGPIETDEACGGIPRLDHLHRFRLDHQLGLHLNQLMNQR